METPIDTGPTSTLEKQISLLNNQVEKLNEKDMNLEAWKSSTIVLLERIFGENNHRIKHIERIKYDYSSWNLRDANGSVSQLDACRKQGKEIIEICINELKNFGLPEDVIKDQNSMNIIIDALESALTVTQYREIIKIIKANVDIEDKKESLLEALRTYGANKPEDILFQILNHKQTGKNL